MEPETDVVGNDGRPRKHTACAVLGALFLCVIVPCLLIWWRNRGHLALFGGKAWSVSSLFFLLLTAVILLSPGTAVLAAIVLSAARRAVRAHRDGRHRAIGRTALLGGLVSFLNFPGYLGLIHLERDDLPLLRLCLLYALTGSICGAWVGWQAYREHHPESPFLPRYSLGTLLLLVLAAGVLVGVFLPRPTG